MKKLESKRLKPKILDGGFRAVQNLYPFLCTQAFPKTEKERQSLLTQYPSEILPEGLYLGNGDEAENEKVIDNLRISHIINITCNRGCPFKHKISYLPLHFEDEPSAEISKSFLEASQFVHDALCTGEYFLASELKSSDFLNFIRQYIDV